MTEAEAYERLTDIFCEVFGLEDIALKPTTTAKDVEGWDSFTNLNLMVAVEGRFGLRIRTNEIEELQNVGDLVRLIVARAA